SSRDIGNDYKGDYQSNRRFSVGVSVGDSIQRPSRSLPCFPVAITKALTNLILYAMFFKAGKQERSIFLPHDHIEKREKSEVKQFRKLHWKMSIRVCVCVFSSRNSKPLRFHLFASIANLQKAEI